MDKTIGTVFPRMEITIYLPALFEEVRLFETNSYQKKKKKQPTHENMEKDGIY